MIIFNNTSADFVLISADVILKIIIILKKLCNCVLKMDGLYVTHHVSPNSRELEFLAQANIKESVHRLTEQRILAITTSTNPMVEARS